MSKKCWLDIWCDRAEKIKAQVDASLEMQANIAEYVAMKGISYAEAINFCFNGGYKKILKAIHKGAAHRGAQS